MSFPHCWLETTAISCVNNKPVGWRQQNNERQPFTLDKSTVSNYYQMKNVQPSGMHMFKEFIEKNA